MSLKTPAGSRPAAPYDRNRKRPHGLDSAAPANHNIHDQLARRGTCADSFEVWIAANPQGMSPPRCAPLLRIKRANGRNHGTEIRVCNVFRPAPSPQSCPSTSKLAASQHQLDKSPPKA